MYRHLFSKFGVSLAIVLSCLVTHERLVHGAEVSEAAELLPASCVLYAEASKPNELINTILNHPLRAELEAQDVWKNVTQTQPYRNFLTGRKFFEVQMGMEWREAIEALTAGGVYAAFDAQSQGAVLLVQGRDTATMETFQKKILELVRMGKEAGQATDQYRGVTVYKLDKGGAAVVGKWLIVVNKGDVGKAVLDRLLDQPEDRRSTAAASLAQNAQFQQAHGQRSEVAGVWGFADLESIRKDDKVRMNLSRQADNMLIEMLAGGIQSTLQKTPWVAAELSAMTSKIALSFQTPFSSAWIPEERNHFFGTEPEGHAPLLPQAAGTVLRLATWRDVSEMWLRAGDLFDENMNDQLANAESTLTTLFAGRDFAEDILGSFTPHMGLVVTRRNFGDTTPQPSIKLPSFALVLEMREPERMTRELRRTFQSMIGFFNVIGAMEGRPQLEMDMKKLEEGELVISEYIPEDDDRDSMSAPIIFNFSPSVGFSGSRFVVSSTQQLAEELVTAELTAGDPEARPNTELTLVVPVLQEILTDNREQLVSQNMLEEGRSREEAEAQIDLLLQLVGYFQSVDLQLIRQTDSLNLDLTISIGK